MYHVEALRIEEYLFHNGSQCSSQAQHITIITMAEETTHLNGQALQGVPQQLHKLHHAPIQYINVLWYICLNTRFWAIMIMMPALIGAYGACAGSVGSPLQLHDFDN